MQYVVNILVDIYSRRRQNAIIPVEKHEYVFLRKQIVYYYDQLRLSTFKDIRWLNQKLKAINDAFVDRTGIVQSRYISLMHSRAAINLDGNTIYIVGNTPYVNFSIRNDKVSRIHALIVPLAGEVMIVDISLKNGIFLNNEGDKFTKWSNHYEYRSVGVLRKAFILSTSKSSTLRIGFYPITIGDHICIICGCKKQKSDTCIYHYVCTDCYSAEGCDYCTKGDEAFADDTSYTI
jgi:hypothetical protein